MLIRLSDVAIRQRIRELCLEQNGVDLRTALAIEGRILGLCEALGGDPGEALGRRLLESVGIKVLRVNPAWMFIAEEGPLACSCAGCPHAANCQCVCDICRKQTEATVRLSREARYRHYAPQTMPGAEEAAAHRFLCPYRVPTEGDISHASAARDEEEGNDGMGL